MKIKLDLLLFFVLAGCFSLTAQVNPTQKRQMMTGDEFEYSAQMLKSVDLDATSAFESFLMVKDNGDFIDLEWDPSLPDHPFPVGYVSGATPTVTAVFTNCTANIWVKGIATLGAGSSNPIALSLPPMPITASGGEATYGPEIPQAGGMDFTLPAKTVAYYENFEIEWKMSATNSTTESDWVTVETSSNPVYATYEDPEESFPFATVIQLGCKYANGISGAEATAGPAIVDAMFAPFLAGTFDVHRLSDNALLTYYADANPSPGGTCINLPLLLASTTGDGRCGAFGELFYRMIKDQGLSDGTGNAIFPSGTLSGSTVDMTAASVAAAHAAAIVEFGVDDIVLEDPTYYFLVKEWSGVAVNSFIPLVGTTFNQAQSSPGGPGIPGQGNVSDPRSIFPNHVYVHYNSKIYDPSYGVTQSSLSLITYENDNIPGVKGTIVRRIESGMPKYYYWVEKVNTSVLELQEAPTTF